MFDMKHRFVLLVAVLNCLGTASISYSDEPNADLVFETRLKPIFDSPEPSSCVQCHLSAVDLKDYILPSSRETFLSLRDQGLIDIETPSESKILHLISMGDSDPDAMSKRIHAKNRKAEYDAFSNWIDACCQDRELLAAKPTATDTKAGPSFSNDLIRHTRKDRVLDSFVRNVWSQRMRCFPCHTPNELDAENPMHKKPIERHQDFVKQYGARMNIFKESPSETLRSLIASSRIRDGRQSVKDDQLPLINLEEPVMSLLIQKPIAKLPAKNSDGKIGEPSSKMPVSHMGGIKMHKAISRTKLGCTGSKITLLLFQEAMGPTSICRRTTGIRRSTLSESKKFRNRGRICHRFKCSFIAGTMVPIVGQMSLSRSRSRSLRHARSSTDRSSFWPSPINATTWIQPARLSNQGRSNSESSSIETICSLSHQRSY